MALRAVLLAVKPLAALAIIRDFLGTHFWVLNDLAIDGLYDSIEIIERRQEFAYRAPEPLEVLLTLEPRQLEILVANLWASMSWHVILTPRAKDGGRDVISTREAAANKLSVYIECKQWHSRVGVKEVRAVLGTLTAHKVPKAILVAPGGFTRGPGSAEAFASDNARIELIGPAALLCLLASHKGADWYKRPERLLSFGTRLAQSDLPNTSTCCAAAGPYGSNRPAKRSIAASRVRLSRTRKALTWAFKWRTNCWQA